MGCEEGQLALYTQAAGFAKGGVGQQCSLPVVCADIIIGLPSRLKGNAIALDETFGSGAGGGGAVAGAFEAAAMVLEPEPAGPSPFL